MILFLGVRINLLGFPINCWSYCWSPLLFLLNGLGYIWGGVGALQLGRFSIPLGRNLWLGFMSWRGGRRCWWRSHFRWIHMNSVGGRMIVTKSSSDRVKKLTWGKTKVKKWWTSSEQQQKYHSKVFHWWIYFWIKIIWIKWW